MALLLNYVPATTLMPRLLSFLFILQTVLPFTAPSMTCDLSDVLGGPAHRSPARSPLSSRSSIAEATDASAPTAATDDRWRLALFPAGPAADVGGPASSIVLRFLVFRGDLLQPPGCQDMVLRL